MWQEAIVGGGHAGGHDAPARAHLGTEPAQGDRGLRPERGLARQPDRPEHRARRRGPHEADHVRGQAVGSHPGSEPGDLPPKAGPEDAERFVPDFV